MHTADIAHYTPLPPVTPLPLLREGSASLQLPPPAPPAAEGTTPAAVTTVGFGAAAAKAPAPSESSPSMEDSAAVAATAAEAAAAWPFPRSASRHVMPLPSFLAPLLVGRPPPLLLPPPGGADCDPENSAARDEDPAAGLSPDGTGLAPPRPASGGGALLRGSGCRAALPLGCTLLPTPKPNNHERGAGKGITAACGWEAAAVVVVLPPAPAGWRFME